MFRRINLTYKIITFSIFQFTCFDKASRLIEIDDDLSYDAIENSSRQMNLDWPKVDEHSRWINKKEKKYKLHPIKVKRKGDTKSFLILQVLFF